MVTNQARCRGIYEFNYDSVIPIAVVGACFAFFVVAALYEGLKFLRDWLMTRTREVLKAKDGDDASMPLLGNSIQINGKKYKR